MTTHCTQVLVAVLQTPAAGAVTEHCELLMHPTHAPALHTPLAPDVIEQRAPSPELAFMHVPATHRPTLQPPVSFAQSPSPAHSTHEPATHFCPPVQGALSSTVPLQSLSMPSHFSALGRVPPTQSESSPQLPFVHVRMPWLQGDVALPQAWVCPLVQGQFSLLLPSQFSSFIAASQTSSTGPTPPLHSVLHVPALQVSVPCLHSPMLLPHGRVTSSSIFASQSLS